MEYADLIKTRYSVRQYRDRPVEKEKLDSILKAGQVAPTAGNRQPQRICVIEKKEALEKIRLCTPCHFDAPMVLLVCYDKSIENNNHFGDGRTYGQIDASIVLSHMMLQAHNVGLGTVWVGLFKPELICTYFDIPPQYEILGLMPIGYPSDESSPSSMHDKRFPICHTVFYNSFRAEDTMIEP